MRNKASVFHLEPGASDVSNWNTLDFVNAVNKIQYKTNTFKQRTKKYVKIIDKTLRKW